MLRLEFCGEESPRRLLHNLGISGRGNSPVRLDVFVGDLFVHPAWKAFSRLLDLFRSRYSIVAVASTVAAQVCISALASYLLLTATNVAIHDVHWLRVVAEEVGSNVPSFLLLVATLIPLFVLFVDHRLCTIYIFFLDPGEPLPLIVNAKRRCIILSARLLEPSLQKRLRDRRNSRATFYSSDILADKRRTSRRNLPFRALLRDLWMLVRFAINRYAPTASGDANITHAERARSIYFTYKLHLSQLKLYVLLVGAAVLCTRFIRNAESSQYSFILGAIAFVWAIASIQIHRRQLSKLIKWERSYATKPFSTSPIFFYEEDRRPAERWEELLSVQFQSSLREYGMNHNELLQLLLAVLLVAYLALLQLVK